MKRKSKTKRSIGPAGASIVSADGKRIKKVKPEDYEEPMTIRDVNIRLRESLDKEGKGAAGKTFQEMKKKTKKLFKAEGGLAEATAKLKAKGFEDGGMVVKDKIVAIDTSPNSGLITVKGFGASRRT